MSLLDSPSKILVAYLVANDVFADPRDSALTWPLYDDFLPDEDGVPDSAGAFFDTDGVTTDREMAAPFEHNSYFGVQLRVRAQKKDVASTQILAACALLEATCEAAITVNGHDYVLQSVDQLAPAVWLGLEAGTKRRGSYTANFLCTILTP